MRHYSPSVLRLLLRLISFSGFFWEGDLHGLTGRQPTSLPLEPDRDRAGERRYALRGRFEIG